MLSRISFAALAATLVSLAACAPQIGDDCSTSTGCSINGDRVCDTSRYVAGEDNGGRGMCTIFNCAADQCPDSAVCVRFLPLPTRREVVACMRASDGDGDCREDDGYRCVEVNAGGEIQRVEGTAPMGEEPITADIVDVDPNGKRKFCVAVDAT